MIRFRQRSRTAAELRPTGPSRQTHDALAVEADYRRRPGSILTTSSALTFDGADDMRQADDTPPASWASVKLQSIEDLVDHLALARSASPTRLRSARVTALTAARLAASWAS